MNKNNCKNLIDSHKACQNNQQIYEHFKKIGLVNIIKIIFRILRVIGEKEKKFMKKQNYTSGSVINISRCRKKSTFHGV